MPMVVSSPTLAVELQVYDPICIMHGRRIRPISLQMPRRTLHTLGTDWLVQVSVQCISFASIQDNDILRQQYNLHLLKQTNRIKSINCTVDSGILKSGMAKMELVSGSKKQP